MTLIPKVEPTPAIQAAQVWLTVRDAAARAQCSDKIIYRAAKTGKLRRATAFGSLRFKPEWVDAWLEGSATPVEVRS